MLKQSEFVTEKTLYPIQEFAPAETAEEENIGKKKKGKCKTHHEHSDDDSGEIIMSHET